MYSWIVQKLASTIVLFGTLFGGVPSVPLGAPLNLVKLRNDIQTVQTNCQTTTGDYCQYLVTGTDYKAVVDVYDGPLGKGYTITIRQLVSGGIDETIINIGPEGRDRNTTRACTDYISATSTDQRICEL